LKITIIIPAYNEADCIESNLLELEEYLLRSFEGDEWETIVVNDGSSDDTAAILAQIQKTKDWLKVINLPDHYGRGRALRAGFDEASGEVIVTLDADFSYAPYHIDRLVRKLLNNHADIVVASAYRKEGSVKNVPSKRLLLSKLGNKILSYMFASDLTVLTCIVRAYQSKFIKSLDLHASDKEIHLEILSKAKTLGAKIVEVPADLAWRPEKLNRKICGTQTPRRSSLEIKKTSSSHLFFALLSKPGVVFWIPGYILICVSLFVLILTLINIAANFASGISLYHAVRNSMMSASLSWLTMVFSFLLGIQFLTLGFLTNQNKTNQEETYRTLHSIYTELKRNK
jgi:glycosyltransferase involved in cell wall biosynthesis